MARTSKAKEMRKDTDSHSGSKSNNFETNTKTEDIALIETVISTPDDIIDVTDEEAKEALVFTDGITSIDFMMPEEEREILEQNLNVYGNLEQMQKTLNVAKRNKALSEEVKTLKLISKTGEFSEQLFDVLMSEDNIKVLDQYIKRKFEEGDVAKAYKEVGLLNKAMLDVRADMIRKLNASKSNKRSKIALKFTNDSGEEFSLGIDTGGDE